MCFNNVKGIVHMQTRNYVLALLVSCVYFLYGCAVSMPPKEFMNKFPKATKTHFYTQLEANIAIENGTCKKLVSNRNYTAAIGYSVDGELDNAAQGVDDWVYSDGGNAFSLNNYRWVRQLVVYFDTLSCKL